MKYQNVLLTGGTGKLGRAIIRSGLFPPLLTPPSSVLDITRSETIERFFVDNDIDAVIHCAALARMAECERDPVRGVVTNVIGTSNLVTHVIEKEKESGKSIRFVHISTDGVYAGETGNYSERSETIPYNKYGWTKLGAECVVNLLPNHCIVRTSFFEPGNVQFDCSATDSYSSKITAACLAEAISQILGSDFVGTVNIGGERLSDYERYRQFKPSLKPCKLEDILRTVSFPMARDASMDCRLWDKIQQEMTNSNE